MYVHCTYYCSVTIFAHKGSKCCSSLTICGHAHNVQLSNLCISHSLSSAASLFGRISIYRSFFVLFNLSLRFHIVCIHLRSCSIEFNLFQLNMFTFSYERTPNWPSKMLNGRYAKVYSSRTMRHYWIYQIQPAILFETDYYSLIFCGKNIQFYSLEDQSDDRNLP